MNALPSRRQMLEATACGFGALAFKGLFAANATEAAAANPLAPRQPHFHARAKRVIFLFMAGGPSQVDTFDFKPALEKQHGKTVSDKNPTTVYHRAIWPFRPRGASGLPVSDLLPNIARHADDLCVINSMHTDHGAHPQAILQMNTGSFAFTRPSVGSWVVHGLGAENQNLPGFVSISPGFSGGGPLNYGSAFLPAACAGTAIGSGGAGNGAPPVSLKDYEMPFMRNQNLNATAQREQLDLLKELNTARPR